MQDPAFRVQKIIIPYVINRNMAEFEPDFNNMLDEKEIYDSELEQKVEVVQKKWKDENRKSI